MQNKLKEIFISAIAVFTFSIFVAGQAAPIVDESKARAEDIISEYKAATGFDKVQADVKFLSLEYERSYPIPQGGGQMSSIYKLSLGSNNEIRHEFINSPGKLPTQYTSIWDKKTYYAKQFDQNGKAIIDKKITLSKGEAANNEDVGNTYWNTFQMLFPITFKSPPWYAPLDFRYVGTTESSDGAKADVIETILDGAGKYQFLFDQKTHLLLMWIITPENKGKRETYHYSDYKENSGLFIAHKIETKGGRFEFTFIVKNITVSNVAKPEIFVIPEK